jgi:hypothetical protein
LGKEVNKMVDDKFWDFGIKDDSEEEEEIENPWW